MIDDAFKLTVDCVFPPLKGDQLPDRDSMPIVDSEYWPPSDEKFPVNGYADE